MKDLRDIVKSKMCLGCGLCAYNPVDEFQVKMKYSTKHGHFVPELENRDDFNSKFGFEICPAKGYPIVSLAKKYNLGDKYVLELGFYDNLYAVTTTSQEHLKNAASSGFMTILVEYLLNQNIIDRVIVTGYEYSSAGPMAFAFSTNNSSDLLRAQGSKYCPVDFSKVLTELKENKDNLRYAVIGTPCQIAGIRNIQSKYNINIVFYISNFCGGFKSYNNLNKLIRLNKMNPSEVSYFRFRGGGQPGSMRIENDHKSVEVPYPDYVKTTGYTKIPRCHFCVDATAELADFSCGDAWLQRYMESPYQWSFIITRTRKATEIYKKVIESAVILSHEVSEDDVIKSQTSNLDSKKFRQASRIKFYKMLGKSIPKITEGYSEKLHYSLWFELNVYISHRLKWMFEKLNLYYIFFYRNKLTKKFLFRFLRDLYN